MKLVCSWTGAHLWGHTGNNGLGLTDEDTWAVIAPGNNVLGAGYTKEHLLKVDRNWLQAFNTIEGGHKPDWKECSCGAKVVMGADWDNHSPTCESLILSSPFEPKNNDGRDTCFKCEDPTRSAGGGQYTVCKNKDCEWYDK